MQNIKNQEELGVLIMRQYKFKLSKPRGGWMQITVKDKETTIPLLVSYLCDPIYMLLNTFEMLLTKERKYLITGEYEWSPFPSLYFEGEGADTYVTLGDCEIIVNVIKDNVYQSHSFLMDWEELMNEVMEQLTDEYINTYCCDWYDNQEEADEIKMLKKKVKDLYNDICKKRKAKKENG